MTWLGSFASTYATFLLHMHFLLYDTLFLNNPLPCIYALLIHVLHHILIIASPSS